MNQGFRIKVMLLFAIALLLVTSAGPAAAQTWRFGMMSDTQWTVPDDGQNPNSVSVGIIKQINTQFIDANVKFVIQVGDLTDNGSNDALDTRAQAAQALYDAGIGFYPFRGNHESSQAAALHFQQIFPQTQGQGPYVYGATGFSSPATNLKGLSYAFTYNAVRFVLLDQFTRTDGSGSTTDEVNNTNIADQLPWIHDTLVRPATATHGFVFGHKNLIGQNHVDFLLGADPSQNPDVQNKFIGTLQSLGVRYYLSGHDHTYHRSRIESPDGNSSMKQLIGASDSSKFYIPAIPSNDQQYDNPTRETPIIQETNRIGYYIFTVDGPRVTVDYYSAEVDPTLVDGEYLIYTTPTLNFEKRDTFGYSLNGHEFLIAEGQSYAAVQDSFSSTHAQILAGINESSTQDGSQRPLTKAVDTGWSAANACTASNILRLWGMSDLATSRTDVYTLSLSYSHQGGLDGSFGLATQDVNGVWVNAIDKNYGGNKQFVEGPWKPEYGLGTYGVDTATQTAWAVINYDSAFAAATFGQGNSATVTGCGAVKN